jgi:hypothetical protein
VATERKCRSAAKARRPSSHVWVRLDPEAVIRSRSWLPKTWFKSPMAAKARSTSTATSSSSRALPDGPRIAWRVVIATNVADLRSSARNRSTVGGGAGPAARILSPQPECHQRRDAPRGERRGLLVLTAGPVAPLLPALAHRLGGFVATGGERSGCSRPLFLRAALNRGTEGLRAMTRTQHDQAVLRRGRVDS